MKSMESDLGNLNKNMEKMKEMISNEIINGI